MKKAIKFADWLNNNWFIPTKDSLWVMFVEHPEFNNTTTLDEKSVFTSEELYENFKIKEGEF